MVTLARAIVPKGVTQQAAFDAAQNIIHAPRNPRVDMSSPLSVLKVSLVSIGTDAFVQNFVANTCRAVIYDVKKFDAIQDGFVHYQLLRFCQATRLQYMNSHIFLGNRCDLQQQHVDCKIADALLNRGTMQYADGWDASSKAWAHMVLRLPHAEGGFGVTFNDL